MALSGKYSAKLEEFKDRLGRGILTYTLRDGSTVEVCSMLENMEIRDGRSTIDAAIPMHEQLNGKMTFLPNGSDDPDYQKTFTFQTRSGDLESDCGGVIFQLILAMSGATDAIIAGVSGGMAKEGIVSVALSFEK